MKSLAERIEGESEMSDYWYLDSETGAIMYCGKFESLAACAEVCGVGRIWIWKGRPVIQEVPKGVLV